MAANAEAKQRYEAKRSEARRITSKLSLSVKEMRAKPLLNVLPTDHERPKTRGECAGGQRPCPYVSCRNHLYLEVSEASGAIQFNAPDSEVWEMAETCALDVAERGDSTYEEVGTDLQLTREGVRQIEARALRKIMNNADPDVAKAARLLRTMWEEM